MGDEVHSGDRLTAVAQGPELASDLLEQQSGIDAEVGRIGILVIERKNLETSVAQKSAGSGLLPGRGIAPQTMDQDHERPL